MHISSISQSVIRELKFQDKVTLRQLCTQDCCGIDYFGNQIEKRAVLFGPAVLWESMYSIMVLH